MTAFSVTSRNAGISNFASGSFTSDNAAATINLGFTPRYVKIVNSTDTIVWEKIEGMAAADVTKVTATTLSVEVGSLITWPAGVLTISATITGNAKAISWIAMG